jgi:hypothetical protein
MKFSKFWKKGQINLYYLTFSIPILFFYFFSLSFNTLFISGLTTFWINFLIALKTQEFFGKKVSRKALTKIGAYILILTFFLSYQLYFLQLPKLILAQESGSFCPPIAGEGCPPDWNCPESYAYDTNSYCYWSCDRLVSDRADPDTCAGDVCLPGYTCWCVYTYRDPCVCANCASSCSSGTTCYYNAQCTSTGPTSSTCTLACSGEGTSCCPDDTTYRTEIVCNNTSPYCHYTDYDRDAASAYCTATDTGCTAFTWFSNLGTLSGTNYPCCGDDALNDDFATYSGSLTTSKTVDCRRCPDGSDAGTTTLYGNGYNTTNLQTSTTTTCYYGDITCSATSAANGASTNLCGNGYFGSACGSPLDKTLATSGKCFYGDMSCGDGTYSNGASKTVYGNGYYDGSLTTSKKILCNYGDINCGDGTASNGTSNTCYGNGYYTGTPSTSTTGTCYYGDITGCGDGTACSNGASTTLKGNGYWTGTDLTTDTSGTCYYGDWFCGDGTYSNGASAYLCGNGFFSSSNTACNSADKTTATSGYCYYGDISCSDGSYSKGSSYGVLKGNGYWSGYTCYYGDISCADGTYGNGASGSTLCPAGYSQCCPNQGTRAEGVDCYDGGISGTSYDRDSSQARCEDGSSYGCTAQVWLGFTDGNNGPCCGDDSTNDHFENAGLGNSACVEGSNVNHNSASSDLRYAVYNGELYFCKDVSGVGSGYTWVQDVNPGSAVGACKCRSDGNWECGGVVGIRGGRIRIV